MRVSPSIASAVGIGALALFGLVSVAHAHHSSSAYNNSKSVEWKVEVTEFRLVNPHAYVFFTMPDAAGKLVQGRCELAARTALARLGWTINTLSPGEKITIKGSPGQNEANVCLARSFVRADGTEVGARENVANK